MAGGPGGSEPPAEPDGSTSADAGDTSTETDQASRPLPRTFVAVNVGTIAYTKPTAGASAHGVSGALTLVPNEKMHRLLQVMERKDEQTGRRLVAGWVLSSTCLPRTDIKRALTDFENVGYSCQESHGVRGDRRREIAGVVICVDTQQLRFLKVGKLVKHKRVIRRGRILRVRLGVVGATDRSGDFDLLGVYMPPRGSGARGFTDETVNSYVANVWGSLTSNMVILGRGGRLMVAGDANAELPESLRRADRVARPADGHLAHFRDMGQMGRIHDVRDWTYTGTYLDRDIYSVIDHVFMTPAMQSQVAWKAVLDGIETDSKRHRALVFTLNIPLAISGEAASAERRVPTVTICKQVAGRPKTAYAACKATYHDLCGEAVQKAVDEAAESERRRGSDLSPAKTIEAIQLGTERAMEKALKVHEEKPSGSSGAAAKPKPGRPFDAGLLRRQRAIFVIHTLTTRRAAIGAKWSKAPSSLEAWDRLFIRPAAKLRFGLPPAYWSIRVSSAWASNIAQAYGTAVKMQILGAGGGHCATRADLEELMRDFGERVGAAGAAAPTSTGVPSESHSHYEALGVETTASVQDIRGAYKRQALLWHPDKAKRSDLDPSVVAEQFRRIQTAHDVLMDGGQRAAHDLEIAQRARSRGQSSAAYGAFCDEGKTKLSRAGLRLAMKRWHLENDAIDTAMLELRPRRDQERESDRSSYYERRMSEAAKQGRTESVAYGLVYTHQRDAANRGGPTSAASSGKLAAISIETTEREELEFQPQRVLDAVRAVMIRQGEARPYSEAGSMALIRWARQHDGLPEKSSVVADEEDDWRQRVFSVSAFQGALRRMRPTGQAAGYDGWLGVLLRWAPFSVQEQYREAIIQGHGRSAGDNHSLPETWPVNLVSYIAKPGKSVTKVEKMRDIWNSVHGMKINTHCTRCEYNRVNRKIQPRSQRGFTSFADAGEAAMTASLHSEMVSSLCQPQGKLFVDLSGFFMGVQRGLLFFLEGEFGVEPGVTAGMQAIHDHMEGRADTAYGLSEAWSVAQGTGQGCVNGPCRAIMQLVVTLIAISRFGGGHCFEVPVGSAPACVKQSWFADDVNTPATGAQGIQLSADAAFIGAWLSGNVIGIAGENDASKTGYQLEDCTMEGGYEPISGYDIRIPTGEALPQNKETYRLLGHEVSASIGNVDTAKSVVYRSSTTCRLLARLAGLALDTYNRLCNAVLVGLALYYGGPTPVDWASSEKIDLEVRKAIRRLGHQAPGGPRVQLYAGPAQGGLGHAHAYANTGSASVIHIDKGLRAQPGDPHGISCQASLRFRAHQLGYVPSEASPTILDWMPTYAIDQMQPERTTDAYWLALMHAKVVTRHSGSEQWSGGPLDPSIEANRPLMDGGGPVIWSLIDSELFSLLLCQVGLVRLVDLYAGRDVNSNGVWLTWREFVNDCSFVDLGVMGSESQWLREAEPKFNAMRRAVASHPEAVAWLRWFAGLQIDDERPLEHKEVQARLDSDWSIVSLAEVKETGRTDGSVEYFCIWHGELDHHNTWEAAENVIKSWRLHVEWASEADRKADARRAIEDITKERGVAPFHLLKAWSKHLPGGETQWHQLRQAERLDEQQSTILELLEVADRHVDRVQRPRLPRRNAIADDDMRSKMDWADLLGGQMMYLGHVAQHANPSSTPSAGHDASSFPQHAGPAKASAGHDASAIFAADKSDGMESESEDDEDSDCADELQDAAGVDSERACESSGPEGFVLPPTHAEEAWPSIEGRRQPSLSPPSEAAMHE